MKKNVVLVNSSWIEQELDQMDDMMESKVVDFNLKKSCCVVMGGKKVGV